MSDSRLQELALTPDEIKEILASCTREVLLVGGQALAVWAQRYGVALPQILSAAVTYDADFIGSARAARKLADALRPRGWRYWQPTLDDPTPQTAKLSKRGEGERTLKQIDFLGSIVGLDTDRIRRRAVTMYPYGRPLQVLHPLDVLESRLKNISALPSKRDRRSIAQARLALHVARCYLEELAAAGDTRRLLKSIERIVRIAEDRSLAAVFHDYGLEPLDAVPVEQVPSAEFHERRWPQVREQIASRRRTYAARRRARTPTKS